MAKGEASLLIRIKQSGGEALDKIKSSLGFLADRAMVVGTALIGFGVAAVKAFKESELASNQLNQAMVQQGVYTADLASKYDKLAKGIQAKTTFDDDQTKSAMALLQAQIGQLEITEELITATADLAAAKQIDLKTAAELVGKSIGTETNALARQGIEIDSTASKTQKLAMVVEQLSGKFGGQAQAAAYGLGSLEQLKNVMGDVLELVGEKLAPYIGFFVGQMKMFAMSLQEGTGFAQGLQSVIYGLAVSFSAVKNAILGTVEVISTGLAAAIESVSLITQGQFGKAKEMAALGMDEVKNIVLERKATFDEELKALDDLEAQYQAQKTLQEEELLKQSIGRKEEMKRGSNIAMFTEEQKQQAKLLGIKLKEAKDLEELEKAKVAARRDSLSTIATLQGESNKTLATIGKAAALTSIAIDTPVAIGKALAAFPPPFNFAAAAAVGAAMAAQAARIGGVKLAEGGIVKASSGGTQAIIGEGGKDEAVIPLDDPEAQSRLGGGGVTINLNGPFMGDESQAREFAVAIDRQLLKLRQSNSSLAFEGDLA